MVLVRRPVVLKPRHCPRSPMVNTGPLHQSTKIDCKRPSEGIELSIGGVPNQPMLTNRKMGKNKNHLLKIPFNT
jgi:hypothetical protein